MREWTEEEVAASIVEEEKYKSERPAREAQERQCEIDNQRFIKSLKYELRYCLFMDALGWASKVKSSESDADLAQQLGLALHNSSFVSQFGCSPERQGDPQVSHFSDCVVVSAQPNGYGLRFVLQTLHSITWELMNQGIFVRGGLTLGKLYHKPNNVYGPALVRAYQMENELAKYPRVIVEAELADLFGQGTRYVDKGGNEIGRSKTWRSSEDFTFFDFLQPFHEHLPGDIPDAVLKLHLLPLRESIVKAMREHSNCKSVKTKYEWLANYFNTIIREFPDSDIEPIELA